MSTLGGTVLVWFAMCHTRIGRENNGLASSRWCPVDPRGGGYSLPSNMVSEPYLKLATV